MASVGSVVYGADYNAVVTKVNEVLGDGTPYGPKYPVFLPTQYSTLPPAFSWQEDLGLNTISIRYADVTFNPSPASRGPTQVYDSVNDRSYYRGTFQFTATGITQIEYYSVGLISILGDYGYNQVLTASAVTATNTINKAEWQRLADDVNRTYKHQVGSTFTGYSSVTGVISYSNLSILNSTMDSCLVNRTSLAVSQKTKSFVQSMTNGGTWGGVGGTGQVGVQNANSGTKATVTIVFSNTNAMQYFFNQGNSFSLEGTGPVSRTAPQDSDWSDFLSRTKYTYDINAYVASSATTGLVTVLTDTTASGAGTVYNANEIRIWASRSTATSTVNIEWHMVDKHNPDATWGGVDYVSAGAGCLVYKTIANGALGTFTGIQPNSITTGTYSVTST
jgi:hypothetical protein